MDGVRLGVGLRDGVLEGGLEGVTLGVDERETRLLRRKGSLKRAQPRPLMIVPSGEGVGDREADNWRRMGGMGEKQSYMNTFIEVHNKRGGEKHGCEWWVFLVCGFDGTPFFGQS